MAQVFIRHSKVSGKAGGSDPNRIYGPDWDALHTVTGLENVDNTSDANKPISTATQAALDAKQPLDATLTALAGVTTAADKVIYATGADAFATTDLTSTARSLLAGASASAMRTTLGVAIGTDVQAFDSDLSAVAGLATTGLVARTGSGTAATRTITAPAAGITLTNGDGVSGNPTLALANDLAALEGLASTGIAARTASDTWAQRTMQAPAAGLTITNPAGVAGDPTFALANDLSAVEGLSGTGIARRTGTDTWSVGTAVSNSELATAAAYTLKGNSTGSSATPTDISISTLTAKTTPAAGDFFLMSDGAASGALKKVDATNVAGASGVSSIDGGTGAFTTSNGITTSGGAIQLTAARRTLPTRQVFASGSGTYTTPANCLWIEIQIVGGGGGGAGSGTGAGSGGSGGNTTFSTLTAGGGGGGGAANGTAGASGSASGGDANVLGGSSGPTSGGMTVAAGTPGGSSFFGGSGGGGYGISGATTPGPGNAGSTNSGGGGGGAGCNATAGPGAGGGGGGYVNKIINSPSATYSYAVGAAGSAGSAGTSGAAGGAGGSGYVIVTEHYNS